MPITHAYTHLGIDDGDPDEVGPSEWNDDHVGIGVQITSIPILTPTTPALVTFNVNSINYADLRYLNFDMDFDVVPWTHFRIYGWGQSNAAGQTITFQMCRNGTTAMSAAGNDVVVTNTLGAIDSGWIAIASIPTGNQRLSVQPKGSNATVDFAYHKLGVQLKYDP